MLFWFQEFINQPMTGDITAAWSFLRLTFSLVRSRLAVTPSNRLSFADLLSPLAYLFIGQLV